MAGKSKTTKAEDLPLRAGICGSQLVISIGIGTLAWAAKKQNGGPLNHGFKVSDKLQFARDVVNALEHENEVGESDLHRLLDKGIQDACDSGSTGLAYPKTRSVIVRCDG